MKWRGQGSLVVLVLAVAAALGYQWISFVKLEDYSIGYGISYQPYFRVVSDFVNKEKRWPEAGEIAFPAVSQDGVIRKVELKSNGEIHFTFSAWTIKSGYTEAVFAPTLNRHPDPDAARLSYYCVEVDPPELMSIVCRSEVSITREEIASANTDALSEWQNNIAAGQKGKGPSLVDKKLPDFLIHFQIRNGLGDMPAFKEEDISKADVKKIILFVKLLRESEAD